MLKTIHNYAHTLEDINVETQVHAPLSSGIKAILAIWIVHWMGWWNFWIARLPLWCYLVEPCVANVCMFHSVTFASGFLEILGQNCPSAKLSGLVIGSGLLGLDESSLKDSVSSWIISSMKIIHYKSNAMNILGLNSRRPGIVLFLTKSYCVKGNVYQSVVRLNNFIYLFINTLNCWATFNKVLWKVCHESSTLFYELLFNPKIKYIQLVFISCISYVYTIIGSQSCLILSLATIKGGAGVGYQYAFTADAGNRSTLFRLGK